MTRPLVVDPKLLASPLRAEIIGRLQTEGPLSIRELARHLSRPANGLYHHVGLLAKGGLLQERERRKAGRREEAVYALVAPRVGSGHTRDPERRAAIAAAAQSALRLAGREFVAALDGGTAPRLSRQRVWLTKDGIENAKRIIARLEELLARENRRREGRLHVLTTALVPLVKR